MTNFTHLSSKIQYIDEDRIEHLDLANDHFNRSHHSFIDSKIRSFRPSLPYKSHFPSLKIRSQSDQQIDYKHLENLSDTLGSHGYINRNGTINFSVILASIHAVICKESHLKICELVMNVIEVYFSLNIISTSKELIDNEIFQLIMDIILRLRFSYVMRREGIVIVFE